MNSFLISWSVSKIIVSALSLTYKSTTMLLSFDPSSNGSPYVVVLTKSSLFLTPPYTLLLTNLHCPSHLPLKQPTPLHRYSSLELKHVSYLFKSVSSFPLSPAWSLVTICLYLPGLVHALWGHLLAKPNLNDIEPTSS